MKLKVKDLVGSLLVLAIAVPYIGYLLNGEMPFVEDPRGMSAVGLVLGAAAFLVLEQGEQRDKTDTAVRGLAVVSAVLGALSNDATSNTISLIGFVLWLVWILGVSHRMWNSDAQTGSMSVLVAQRS